MRFEHENLSRPVQVSCYSSTPSAARHTVKRRCRQPLFRASLTGNRCVHGDLDGSVVDDVRQYHTLA